LLQSREHSLKELGQLDELNRRVCKLLNGNACGRQETRALNTATELGRVKAKTLNTLESHTDSS